LSPKAAESAGLAGGFCCRSLFKPTLWAVASWLIFYADPVLPIRAVVPKGQQPSTRVF